MKWLKVPYNVAPPGALIGVSNFFEPAAATAIALYGAGFGRRADNCCGRASGANWAVLIIKGNPALVRIPFHPQTS